MEPAHAQETLGHPQNQPQELRKERGASGRLSLPFTRLKRLESGSQSLRDTPVKQQHPPPSGHGGQRLTVSEVQWVPRMEQRTNVHPSVTKQARNSGHRSLAGLAPGEGQGHSLCARQWQDLSQSHVPVACLSSASPQGQSQFLSHIWCLNPLRVGFWVVCFLFFSGVPNGQPFPWQRTARALLSL